MHSRGVGRLAPPSPQKKALENRYRVEMQVHSPIFQGQLRKNQTDIVNSFQKYSFQICSFSHKKVWVILDFFTDRTFFLPCTLPCKLKKIVLTKKPLNYCSLKVTKFHGDIVKNERARTKKLQGGAKRPPPLSSLFRVKPKFN